MDKYKLPQHTVENLTVAIATTDALTANLRRMNDTLERMMANKEDVEELANTLVHCT